MSVAAVLLAAVQMSATVSTAVLVFGQLSLTNLIAASPMSDYSRTVASGLMETRFTHINLSCKINECFMLEYEPLAGQIGITADTPGDTTYAGGHHIATAYVRAVSAMINGKSVVAVINDDMFNMTTNQPWGAITKDGVEVQDIVSSRAYRWNFSGIKRDGTPVIASNVDYPQMKFELQNATGLYDTLLVKDGNVITQKNADQRTYSPRLGVGVRADGTVFFVMVDGRQFQYPTGTTPKEFTQSMKNMGAVQAGNLDAGDLATLLSRNYGNSTLLLRNKPSDGRERPIPNSLLFVTKSISMQSKTGLFATSSVGKINATVY